VTPRAIIRIKTFKRSFEKKKKMQLNIISLLILTVQARPHVGARVLNVLLQHVLRNRHLARVVPQTTTAATTALSSSSPS